MTSKTSEQLFAEYVAATNANLATSPKRDELLLVWQAHEHRVFGGKEPLPFEAEEERKNPEFAATVAALIELGPLNGESDFVVCRCGRIVLKKEHHNNYCRYYNNRDYEFCDYCAAERFGPQTALDIPEEDE